VFGLILVATVFKFYFFVIVATIVVGIATFIWIRFVRFPPEIAAYNGLLRRARLQSQARRDPMATVRSRRSQQPSSRQRRRRR
jgi:hypothetical protein